MGIPGSVATSAHKWLREQLADQLLQEQLADRRTQQQFENQMREKDFAADEAYRKSALESQERQRRDVSNWRGIEEMNQQAGLMAEADKGKRERQIIEGLLAREDIPQSTKDAIAAGVKPSAEHFKTTAELEAERTRKKTEKEEDWETQARISAKYRQPREPREGPQPNTLVVSTDGKKQRYVTAQEASRLVDEGGWSVTTPGANRSATSAQQTREGRLNAARTAVETIDALRKKVNTGSGIGQKVTGAIRTGKAAMGLDPIVSTMQKVRTSGGRAIAVGILGAQNLSDADADAWASLLPDAMTDDRTAAAITTFLLGQVDAAQSKGVPDDAPSQPPPPGIVQGVMEILEGKAQPAAPAWKRRE